MIKKSNIIFLLFIFLLFFVSCGKEELKITDRWEGIKIYKLRVYVRLDNQDEIENGKASGLLLKAGRKRAIRLITGYVKLKVKDKSKIFSLNDRIQNAAKNGKLFYNKCNESYCEAFIDYNIKELTEEINKTGSLKTK